MIEDFVHEGGALYCGPSMARIVPVIQRELDRARSSGEPVALRELKKTLGATILS
jgi:nicotinamidase-related amidase